MSQLGRLAVGSFAPWLWHASVCRTEARKVALRAAKQNLVNGARPETPGMNERGPPMMTPLWANPAPASLPAQFGLVGGGDSTLA